MPVVDMTQFGLAGQQAFAERMQTLAQADQASAAARVNEQAAATAAFELSQAQRMEEIDRQAAASLQALAAGERPPGSGPALDPSTAASPHEHLGRFYIQAGAVERGTALLNEASEIRKREVDAEKSMYEAQGRRMANIQTGAEIVSQTLGIAQTEDEYRLGLQRLREAVDNGVFVMEPELLERLEAMPWNPNLPAYFNQAAIDAKGRADLELRELSEARQAQEGAIRLAQGAARVQIAAARLASQNEHQRRMEKHAGTTGGAVSVNATARDAMAARLIAGPLANFVDPVTQQPVESSSSIVRDLAIRLEEDAQLLVKANPGLTMDQARARAVQTAQDNGEIVPATPDTQPFFLPSNAKPGEVKRSPARDAGVGTPVPTITVNGQRQVDPSKLVVGESYWIGNQRLKWDGEGFEE
jgi:tetratricopeptide (TPR) repeat protein